MSDAVDVLAVRWAAFVWPGVWHATVVAILALGVFIPLLRRISPALAMAVAGIALAKFFMPPLFVSPIAVIDRVSGWLEPSLSPHLWIDDWRSALLVAHTAGAAIVLGSVLMQRRRVQSARAGGTAILEGPLRDELRDVAQHLGMTIVPLLVVSDTIEAPIACGQRRPAIVLPQRAVDVLDRGQLRLVLAHELAHHKARDLLVEVVLVTATAVWWFHPACWALANRVRELREERCDALVVRTFGDPERYCRALLAVAASRFAPPAVAMRREGHPLRRRFERLLSNRRPARWHLALATILVGAFAFAALPNTPRRDRGDDVQAPTSSVTVRVQVRVIEVRQIGR